MLLSHLAVLGTALLLSLVLIVTGVRTGSYTVDDGVATYSGPAPLVVSLAYWAGALGVLVVVLRAIGRRRPSAGARWACATAAWAVVPWVWVGLPGAGEHPEVATPLYLIIGGFLSIFFVLSAVVGGVVMTLLARRRR